MELSNGIELGKSSAKYSLLNSLKRRVFRSSSFDDVQLESKSRSDSLTSLPRELGPSVVSVRNLRKEFVLPGGEVVAALKGVHLNEEEGGFPAIRQGEFVMIRGPSGGGKTTLLNILGTIDTPTAGEVHMFGTKVEKDSTDRYLADLRLKKIGFVFQTFNLIATMSAYENVELPMTVLGKLSNKAIRARALELLDMVGLEDRYGHLPSELSGGEQQRVTIARALSNDPDILLLDEPTGDLDTRNTVEIMDLVLKINQERGRTVIMVTHNPDLECYAHRILYVEDGMFKKQATNTRQCKINYEQYMKYVNSL